MAKPKIDLENKQPSWPSWLSLNRLRKILGNILIVISFCLILSIYLPILKAYLPVNSVSQVDDLNLSITIPKINAYAPLIDDVDPWNENEYRQALKKGVAIAKNFSRPGESGTTFIFAHSSDSPWRISSYNTVFFRLGELNQEDLIEINYKGGSYKYSVLRKIEVWPDQVEAIANSETDQLILQTCTPIGTSLKRLLVFAIPIKEESPREEPEAF